MQRGRSFKGKSSSSNRFEFPCSPNGVELEPSNTCPKNFVIFDRTENKSRIMFNPALAHRFNSPSFNIHGIPTNGNRDDDDDVAVSKEDTEDIDALLSSDGEGEDEEDDAISSGRTPGNFGGSSPDSSCSSLVGQGTSKLSASAHGGNCSRRQKTRKMVRTLRGIIPGGDQMDTPAVLDEAVRYLKSLKVEAKKLGIQNINHRNGEWN